MPERSRLKLDRALYHLVAAVSTLEEVPSKFFRMHRESVCPDCLHPLQTPRLTTVDDSADDNMESCPQSVASCPLRAI